MSLPRIEIVLPRNPFPLLAHGGSLGGETPDLTVKTERFERVLSTISRSADSSEPLGLAVLGAAGAGKTHFLKYLQYTLGPEPDSTRGGSRFDRVVYLKSPGRSFAELAGRVLHGCLEDNFLKTILDRLVAFPVIELCRKKVARGEDVEHNEEVIDTLDAHPEGITAYWGRFSKGEMLDTSIALIEKTSKHPVFRQSLLGLLRAVRDERELDITGPTGQLEEGARLDSDLDAIQLLESLLGTCDALGLRLLLLVDECQLLLRGEDEVAENELFRQVVNATPRGSVMAFALRTEDWEKFKDSATERRMAYYKMAVSPDEAWRIVQNYISIKGGSDQTTREPLFSRESVEILLEAGDRSIGRTLALCHQVYERVRLAEGRLSIEDAAREAAVERSGEVPVSLGLARADDGIRTVLEELKDPLKVTVDSEFAGYLFALRERTPSTEAPILVVEALGARDDYQEASEAFAAGRRLLELRRQYPSTGAALIVSGYRSTEVISILRRLADTIVKFEANTSTFRLRLADEIKSSVSRRRQAAAREWSVTDDLRLVDQLGTIAKTRLRENTRLGKESGERFQQFKASTPQKWLLMGVVAALAVIGFGWLRGWLGPPDGPAFSEAVSTAVGQITSDKAATRAIGIHSLSDLAAQADDSSDSHLLVSVLSSQLRDTSSSKPGRETSEIQAIMEILGRSPLSREYDRKLRPALGEVIISGVDLSEMTLSWTDLSHSHLQDVDMRGTDLQNADLRRAELSSVNLEDANLAGARLDGANLLLAKGLTQPQLEAACGDGSTLLPPGIEQIGRCEPITDN